MQRPFFSHETLIIIPKNSNQKQTSRISILNIIHSCILMSGHNQKTLKTIESKKNWFNDFVCRSSSTFPSLSLSRTNIIINVSNFDVTLDWTLYKQEGDMQDEKDPTFFCNIVVKRGRKYYRKLVSREF